ncbi:2-methylthioadenine synthetase [Aggregatibacter actinomycetemcomitans serotype f str. SC29R]|nr:2-methylthioadenine synthetase [Aggregatibacter actinomycetemcomitans serotype f str. SC29R]
MIVDEVNMKGVIGRSMVDAPEIDGVVYVENQSQSAVNIGDVISVTITDADEYDLWGTC